MTDEPAPMTGPASEVEQLRAELKRITSERDKLRRRLEREKPLRPYQIELIKLQRHLEEEKTPMIVLFEGRDAAGKGGAIRRITRYMNPRHTRVVALGKPSSEQRTQWYFQRYVEQFPRAGEMVLFDRSWYNRALVEPVFGFCTKSEHRNFLRGVVGFEKDIVRQGIVLIKLYFSVDKKVQARRFKRRIDDPLRSWKLSEIDLQAQEYWEDFSEMKHIMLERTSTAQAPWTIVRANKKVPARINTMKVMLGAVDYADRDPKLDYTPDPTIIISGADELARLDAERGKSRAF